MAYTVHGIRQARILEWVTISFSRGSSQLRDSAQVDCRIHIAGGFFYQLATREAQVTKPPHNPIITIRSQRRKNNIIGTLDSALAH